MILTRFKQKLLDDIPQLKCWNPYLKVSESKELSDSINSSIYGISLQREVTWLKSTRASLLATKEEKREYLGSG